MIRKHWKLSKHFAERVLLRVQGDYKPLVRAINKEFNATVLQKIFECVLHGESRRVTINGFDVCYKWDSNKMLLVVTTVFKNEGDHQCKG